MAMRRTAADPRVAFYVLALDSANYTKLGHFTDKEVRQRETEAAARILGASVRTFPDVASDSSFNIAPMGYLVGRIHVRDCEKQAETQALCYAHYKRFLIHGDAREDQGVADWALSSSQA